MAKYSFKLYLKNGEVKTVVPSELTDADLPYLDKFAIKTGSSFGLAKVLADEVGIDFDQVDNISILKATKKIEFSVIYQNKYLEPVFSNLKTKTITCHGYQKTVTAVDFSNPNCLEMKEYLLDNIRNNYDNFSKNVYNYENEFSRLLYRYSSIYQQRLQSEEDLRAVKELEEQILTELSIYKNYRGLCKARLKSEKQFVYTPKRSSNSVTNLNINDYAKNSVPYTFDKDEEVAKQTVSYNQEYDEFLEADEYEKMLGDSYNKL